MEPILMSVAAAAAGKFGEAAFKGGVDATKKVAALIRGRFAAKADESAVLEAAERGEVPLEKLAEVVRAACAADPDFRAKLSDVIGEPVPVQIAKFHNDFHGDVKNVVQADTIHNLRLD